MGVTFIAIRRLLPLGTAAIAVDVVLMVLMKAMMGALVPYLVL